MLKVRAFRFDLRNKINNLKVVYKKDQDPVFQNQQVDIRERRLKKRQEIRFIYRQRIAKDFVITKKGNTIIQKLAKEYSSYIYFGAKGLVVMAKNFYGLKDSFQATYILESVIKNFKNFTDVVDEAQQELDTIKTEEAKTNSSITK